MSATCLANVVYLEQQRSQDLMVVLTGGTTHIVLAASSVWGVYSMLYIQMVKRTKLPPSHMPLHLLFSSYILVRTQDPWNTVH